MMSGRWFRLLLVLVVLAAALLTGRAFIRPGHQTSPDVWSHLSRQAIVGDCVRSGESPFHTFFFYCGYPHLRFYSPLLALVGGLVMAAGGWDGVAVLKGLLFALHLLSGLAMVAFLRRRTGSLAGAALGTIVFLAIPWRVVNIAVIANSPQSLVYVMLPLVFLGLEMVLERPGARGAALLALGLGLLVISHLFYALFTVVFVLVALAVRLPGRDRAGPAAAWTAGAGLAAVAVAGFNVIPFALEFRNHQFPGVDTTLPVPDPGVLFNPWSVPGGYSGTYLGLSAVFLTIVGIAALLAGQNRRRFVADIVGLVLALLLVFAVPRLGRPGALLTLGLPGVRFLAFVVFFAGVLVADGFAAVERRLSRRPVWGRAALIVLAAALLVDCLPQLLGIRYSTEQRFRRVREQAYELLAQQGADRVLDVVSNADRVDDFRRLAAFPSVGFLYGGLATPLGPAYYQFAPRSMLYVYPWTNEVARDLGDPGSPVVGRRALTALALTGVSHVIAPPTEAGREDGMASAFLKQGIPWFDGFLQARLEPPLAFGPTGFGPVLASNRLAHWPSGEVGQERTLRVAEDWRDLVDALDVDRVAGRMSFIPVLPDRPAGYSAGLPELRVLETRTGHDRVTVRVLVSTDCFLRLAYSYYPWLRVLVDGREVEFGETSDHFIWLACPGGEHMVEVRAPTGPLRQATTVLSVAAVLVCCAALVISRRGSRSGDSTADSPTGEESEERDE